MMIIDLMDLPEVFPQEVEVMVLVGHLEDSEDQHHLIGDEVEGEVGDMEDLAGEKIGKDLIGDQWDLHLVSMGLLV